MKKITKLVASLLSLTLLAGCSDAHVKLNDANTGVFKVGNKTVTKGEMFRILNANSAYVVTNDAISKICDIEVPVTDEMQANVDEMIKSIKSSGEGILDYYTQAYGSLEQYTKQLLRNQQLTALYEKYVTENIERLISEQSPAYATILTFTSEEDANAALSGLNDGSLTVQDVLQQYATSSSGQPEILTLNTTTYPAEALTLARSNKKDDGWAKVNTAAGDQFCLVRVEEDDPNTYKDALITNLARNQSIQSEASASYMKKHNFKVYDKDVLDAIKESYPEYLN